MFYHECWKSIYFGVKGQGHEAVGTRNSAGVGFCSLASSGFFKSWDPSSEVPYRLHPVVRSSISLSHACP